MSPGVDWGPSAPAAWPGAAADLTNGAKEAPVLPKPMSYALALSAVHGGCTAIFVHSENPFRCALRA